MYLDAGKGSGCAGLVLQLTVCSTFGPHVWQHRDNYPRRISSYQSLGNSLESLQIQLI